MKNQQIKRIALVSVLSAMSVVLYFFVKFPLPFLFPSFLDIQFSNLPAILGGFVLGPVAGSIIVIVRFLIKLPFTSTMYVGEFADLVIGLSVVLTSSLIYKKNRTKKGGVYALIAGSLMWVLTSVLANYFVLVPLYLKLYFGGNVNAFIGLCKVIPGINEANYMSKYLLFAVIPFNLLLSAIVSLITFLVYKRLSDVIKIEHGAYCELDNDR